MCLLQLNLVQLFFSLSVASIITFRFFFQYFPASPTVLLGMRIAGMCGSFNNGTLLATLTFVCIERLVATMKTKTYETSKNPWLLWTGAILSACTGLNSVYFWNISCKSLKRNIYKVTLEPISAINITYVLVVYYSVYVLLIAVC